MNLIGLGKWKGVRTPHSLTHSLTHSLASIRITCALHSHHAFTFRIVAKSFVAKNGGIDSRSAVRFGGGWGKGGVCGGCSDGKGRGGEVLVGFVYGLIPLNSSCVCVCVCVCARARAHDEVMANAHNNNNNKKTERTTSSGGGGRIIHLFAVHATHCQDQKSFYENVLRDFLVGIC